MLEQLVASVSAWSKAAKQRAKPPVAHSDAEARALGLGSWTDAHGNVTITTLPSPKSPVVPLGPDYSGQRDLDPRRYKPPPPPPVLRPGDLGPGIVIPPNLRQAPPVLPPATVTHTGTVGHPPTVNTNPPPIYVPPHGTVPRAAPPTGTAVPDGQVQQRLREIDELKKLLEVEVSKHIPKGHVNRGEQNVHGTYPYDVQGHGPTPKYLHETLHDQMLHLREKAPHLFYAGAALRAKPLPPGAHYDTGEPIPIDEAYLGGWMGQPTQKEQYDQMRQQRLMIQEQARGQQILLQQQHPEIYGQPGTTFRDPTRPGSRARSSVQPGAGGVQGPLNANQQALDSVIRLRTQMQGLTTPARTPAPRRRSR